MVRQIWLIHRRESGGAFLLTRAGDLRWADLGPAAAIDPPVQDLIAAANDWSAPLAAKEAAGAKSAEQTAQDALRTLSQKLSPVIAQLAHHKEIARLRIAPDGVLNMAPFGALSDARGSFLIQHYAINYVTASRDLTGVATAEPSASAVIAVSPGASRQFAAGTSSGAFRAERLERLEDAEREARDVKKWVPGARFLTKAMPPNSASNSCVVRRCCTSSAMESSAARKIVRWIHLARPAISEA